jgi:hypothetical protein
LIVAKGEILHAPVCDSFANRGVYVSGYESLMESASKHATEPNAFKIDGYLNRLLPGIVKEIRIE